MDDTNGLAKAPKALNGLNGSLKPSLNGHAVGPRTRKGAAGAGLFARGFNIVARLLIWYAIGTILLRCPATLDACDQSSPGICKPYFQLKHAVSPHLEPYYDTYAAPYVDLVQPYYNTVDERVIAPSWRYAKKHGAPRLEQAQGLALAQWQKSVQPQIAKYQELANSKYDETLAPHISTAKATFSPYYDIARTNALQTYHEVLLPSYEYVHPYARKGYAAASAFTTSTAVPAALWTWNKTYTFLDGTVWPQLRVIYVENVEPQLVKIGKRLGRYNGSDKKTVPKTIVNPSSKTVSSFIKPTPSVPPSSNLAASSDSSSSVTTPTIVANTAASKKSKQSAGGSSAAVPTVEPITPPEPNEQLESEDADHLAAREVVAADLRDWQERYDKAAKEGSAEINDQVREISRKMVRRNAKIIGKSVIDQLQTAIVKELVQLRRNIVYIVGSVNKGSATQEEGREQIVKVVRNAGLAIREKAANVRGWREHYEAEMKEAITKAAENHFAILEEIQDLALQKIGMKWAWTEGITYKDWEKYHQLKRRFSQWRDDIQESIVSHPSLEAAQAEGAEIEDEGMKLAANAAKELARLKQVAAWKLISGDDTTEFDSTLMEQAAEAATHAATVAADTLKQAKDAIVEQAEAVVDAVSSAILPKPSKGSESSVLEEDDASVTSESPASDNETPVETPVVETATSEPEEPVEVAAEEVAAVVEPTSEPEAEAEPEHADASGSNLASAIILEELEETPLIVGNATEPDAGDASPAPVELPVPNEALIAEEAAVIAEPLKETLIPSATPSVKSAFLGAAAQSVPSRQPVLDDDEDDSDTLELMANEIRAAYSKAASRANSQYSQALSIMSAQIHGTPEPAHQKVIASVTDAYSNAMASASSRMDDALKLASEKYYGTPTKKKLPVPVPTIPSIDWAQIESVAAERLNQGLSWAEEQYESAKIAVGLATPTPSTPAEHLNRVLENARHNYYAGVGVAHARYTEFLAAATSALSSLTATPTPTDLAGTASSLGSVASESAASVASAISANAASAASAASASAYSAASAAGENAAYAASVASEKAAAAVSAGYDNASAAADKVAESWDVIVTRISIQVYGAPTPTPFYESVYSAAIGGASSATEAIGDGASSAASIAGAYAAAATDGVAQQYEAVSSIVSELLVGKEPTFSESVVSRLQAAYTTGLASASSIASEATEAVKHATQNIKDEL
ncbi:hypothetical protein B0T16DRAFT_361628 [Cercophora newfieldiana]|uniref:Transcription factor hoxa13 n=1 Tax=Cercophora newfieldiana TaxID=92897 RepID=A0AA40CIT2_9PEZI|nr:hypothetical protein B0T16DRAFT_361628 [Cercophora newfieldiana]